MERLGGSFVAERVSDGGEVEYQLGANDPVLLSRLLAEKDAEIANLNARIAALDAEIERLTGQRTAPSLAMVHQGRP